MCAISHVSFCTLSVSNSSLLWTKALACKTISTVTLFVLLITYVHIERLVTRLACRVIARMPLCSPFSLLSHGGSQRRHIKKFLSGESTKVLVHSLVISTM